MKKFLKIFFGILGSLLLIVVILAIVLAILICDGTDNTNKELYDNAPETSEVLSEYLYTSLENTKTTEAVDFDLTENELNTLLYSISKKISIPQVTIKSITAFNNGEGSLRVEVPIQYLFFKSCLKSELKLTKNENDLVLDFSDVKIGKLQLDSWIIKNTVFKAVNLDSLEATLSNNGIYMDINVNASELNIKMTYDDVIKTISNKTDSEVAPTILSALFDNPDLFSLDTNKNGKTGFVLNARTLTGETLSAYDLEKTTYLATAKSNCEALLQTNKINNKNLSVAFNFILNGYETLNDDDKKVAEKIDFTSLGITSNKSYQGLIPKNHSTMKDVIRDNASLSIAEIQQVLIDGRFTVDISEESLNGIFADLDFIGKSFVFSKDNKVAYITINSFYSDIKADKLDLFFVVDLNGCNSVIKVSLSKKSSAGLSMVLQLDNVYIGTNKLSDKTEVYLMKFLESSMDTASLAFITPSASDKTITLDFAAYFTEDLTIMKNIKNTLKNSSLELLDGKLEIVFSK